MYLRESKQRRADGSVVTYLQLAQNVWDAAKGRSQASIVHNCGRADDSDVIERLRRLAKSILRRCSAQEIVAAGGDWRLICAWPYGDIYVLEAIWKQLGIDAIVRQQAGTRHLGFDVERALFALVAKRACAPASKLYCHEQWLKEDAHIAGTQALMRIGELYAIEAQGRDLCIEARAQLRQEQALPRLTALHDWLIATRLSVAEGSGTAKALDYSLKRWSALSRYATAGDLPIDNNPVENDIRPVAIGKKNWLFTGSERAGKRAAAIQSLLYTAKLNGLDPAAWLRDTLEKLPTCPNSQIDSLLPLRDDALHQ